MFNNNIMGSVEDIVYFLERIVDMIRNIFSSFFGGNSTTTTTEAAETTTVATE